MGDVCLITNSDEIFDGIEAIDQRGLKKFIMKSEGQLLNYSSGDLIWEIGGIIKIHGVRLRSILSQKRQRTNQEALCRMISCPISL